MSNDNTAAIHYAKRARRYSLIAALGSTAVVALEYLADLSLPLLVVFVIAAGAAWYSFAKHARLI